MYSPAILNYYKLIIGPCFIEVTRNIDHILPTSWRFVCIEVPTERTRCCTTLECSSPTYLSLGTNRPPAHNVRDKGVATPNQNA